MRGYEVTPSIQTSKTMPVSLKEYIMAGLKKSFKESFKERRGRLEIIADILLVAKRGAKKTAIADNANVNFNRVGNYLLYLEERGLIEHTRGEYRTTEKGKEFLRNYRKIKEQLFSDEKSGICSKAIA